MPLKHGLLGILDCGEMTGYELNRLFKESLAFFWHAQTSQIYRELASMEGLGWLTATVVPQSDRPNKKLYAITPDGKNELLRWLREDNSEEEFNTKNPFLMRMFFLGLLPPEDGIAALERYRDLCASALKALSVEGSITEYSRFASTPTSPIYWGITADFGRRFYEMSLAWATESIEQLKGDKI